MRIKIGIAIVPLIAVVASSRPSYADDADVTEATKRMQEGNDLFARKQYDAARRKYLQACTLDRTARCLANLAFAEYYLGHCAEALTLFDEALSSPTASGLLPASGKELRRESSECSGRVGHVRAQAPEGARILADGRDVGAAPLRNPIHLVPGAHVIEATFAGKKNERREVAAVAGETVTADLTPPPEPLPASAPAVTSVVDISPPKPAVSQEIPAYWTPARRTAVIAGGAITALSLVGATIFWRQQVGKADDLKAASSARPSPCTNPETSACADLRDKRDSANTAGTLKTVALVGAGVGVVTIITALAWPTREPEQARRDSKWIRPLVAPMTYGLAAGGTF